MKAIGNSAHARCQKGGVPEEVEIGRTRTPFKNESTEANLKNNSKNKAVGNSAHARCQKGWVPGGGRNLPLVGPFWKGVILLVRPISAGEARENK